MENVELRHMAQACPPGLILEFGVAGGKSIRELAAAGRPVFGFDSWQGLPHDWGDEPKGSFACAKPDVPPNVTLVEGLFSDTLPAFLSENHDPVALVHIDCDLYCPCIFVLHCLVDRFVAGSIIMFDEITDTGINGEHRAWNRYLRETNQPWAFLGKQHNWGEVYRYVDMAHGV